MAQYPLPPKPISHVVPTLQTSPVSRQMPHQQSQSKTPHTQAWTASQATGRLPLLPGLGTPILSSPSEPVTVSNNNYNRALLALRQPLQNSAQAFASLPPLELSYGSIPVSTNTSDLQHPIEREEGEVSEAEMSNRVPTPQHAQQTAPGNLSEIGTVDQRRSPPRGPRIDSRSRLTGGTDAIITSEGPLTKVAKQLLDGGSVSNGYDSYKPEYSQNPQAQLKQSSSIQENTKREAQISHATGASSSDVSNTISREYLASQRANAKKFILAWHKNGYTFSQLVEEKLDASFLRGIYQELGISAAEDNNQRSPNDSQPAALQEKHQGLDVTNLVLPNVQDQQVVPSSQTKLPQSSATVAPTPQADEAPAKLEALPMAAASTDSKETSAPAKTLHSPTLPNAISSRPVLVKPQPPVPDRQNYIARLMAAKSKKTQNESVSPVIPSRPIPEVVLPGISAQPGLVVEAMKTSGTTSVVRETKETINQEVTSAIVLRSTFQDNALAMEGKRRAQTELARLRMQALESARLSAATKSGLSSVTASPGKTTSAKLPDRSPDRVSSEQPIVVEPNPSKSAAVEGSDPRTPSIFDDLSVGNVAQDDLVTPADSVTSSSASPAQSIQLLNLLPTTQVVAPGRIPGLFMTSPLPSSDIEMVHADDEAATASIITPAMGPVTAARPHKRPVAADFDYGPPSNVIKRPFGHVRNTEDNEGIIIEASDDETAPSDIQEPNGTEGGELQNPLSQVLTFGSGSINSSAIASSITPQLITTQPGEKGPTNQQINHAGAETVASPRPTKNLKLQEDQILAMKKRIAEMEQKRMAKALTSRATTPSNPKPEDGSRSSAPPNTHKSSTEKKASSLSSKLANVQLLPSTTSMENEVGMNRGTRSPRAPVSDETSSARAPLPVLSNTQATAAAATASSSAANWRQKRKVEIETGLPLLEARFASNQSKFELLKQQMKALEDAMQKEAEDKQRLIEELESLGVDTEGMPHAVLQSTKNDLMAKMDMEEDARVDNMSTSVLERDSVGSSTSKLSKGKQTDLETPPENENEVVSRRESASNSRPTSVGTDVPSVIDNSVSEKHGAQLVVPPSLSLGVIMDDATSDSGEIKTDSSLSSAADLHSNLSSQDEGERAASARSNDSVKDTIEITKGAVTTPLGSSTSISDVDIAGDETKIPGSPPALDDSDEYEPPDALAGSPSYQQPVQDIIMNSDSDYEPPDNIPDFRGVSTSLSTNSPFQKSSPLLSNPNQHLPARDLKGGSLADESAPETQSLAASASPRAATIGELFDLPLHERFKPYDSPLTTFKSYRNHPNFEQKVPGGLRSTTYSHNIDADKPLCTYEVAGGTCNDSKCEGQHFRSINIGDDEILKQIGTANPGVNDAEKKEYTLGLRQLVSDLRQKNIKDSGAVASEIFAYRRRFLGDPTRVLNL